MEWSLKKTVVVFSRNKPPDTEFDAKSIAGNSQLILIKFLSQHVCTHTLISNSYKQTAKPDKAAATLFKVKFQPTRLCSLFSGEALNRLQEEGKKICPCDSFQASSVHLCMDKKEHCEGIFMLAAQRVLLLWIRKDKRYIFTNCKALCTFSASGRGKML